jgi:prepilin-type N-terminal cleavage/methylation domain-containing protein
MTRTIIKTKRGFTLVETMVAISLLTIAVIGTLTAVQNGLQDTTIAKDQTVAFHLAQEGMEFIKNKRDENVLKNLGGSPTNWLHGLSEAGDPCFFGKTCRIDSYVGADNPGGIVDCGGSLGSCPVLREDSNSGLFGYNGGWPATYFKREIQFQSISADEVMVTMTISWTNRGNARSFQVAESLFNR